MKYDVWNTICIKTFLIFQFKNIVFYICPIEPISGPNTTFIIITHLLLCVTRVYDKSLFPKFLIFCLIIIFFFEINARDENLNPRPFIHIYTSVGWTKFSGRLFNYLIRVIIVIIIQLHIIVHKYVIIF